MSTLISWSDETWNPTTGCDRVSPGCAHCYALELAGRFRENPKMRELGIYQRDGGRASGPGFALTLRPEVLEKPLHWKKPRRVFVNSMSDLFHEEIPDDYLDRVFAVMALCPQHTFQILTKRLERALPYLGQSVDEREARGLKVALQVHQQVYGWTPESSGFWGMWPLPNVLIGPTVENQRMADARLPVLAQIKALGWRTMVSYEPALGPVDFRPWLPFSACAWDSNDDCVDCIGVGGERQACGLHTQKGAIDWLICGAESGPKRRPFDYEWARLALAQARAAGVLFWFKQGPGLRSENLDTLPDDLKVREFPA